MNASMTLWTKWHEQVKELLPGVHGHQKKTLALCVVSIILSGSAVLQRMAESIYLAGMSEAKMPSIERRLARFVANQRVQVSKIWKLFLTQVLASWKGKAVQLVLDGTPFGNRATIVYLGLLVHSRVLPVAWRIMPQQEEWDQGQWELVGELLDAVSLHLEPMDCTVIADRGLAGLPLVNLCRDRGFHYLLRVCKEHTCRRKMGSGWTWWCALQHIVRAKGQQWYGRVLRLRRMEPLRRISAPFGMSRLRKPGS